MALVPVNYKPETIRNVIIAIMSEFNNINIDVITPGTSGDNTIIKSIDVPLQFGQMEKYQTMNLVNHPDESQRYYESLPKMALSWTSITYNGDRERGTEEFTTYLAENTKLSDADEFVKNVNPTPYDMGFELEIRTQSLNQFTQILDQILPFFNPNRQLRVKEFTFLNVERNIKLRNDGLSQDFLIEQTEENRRYINGTIAMTAEAFMYRPLSSQSLIKEIRTKYFPMVSASDLSATEGFNTSGWNSSADFTLPTSAWDVSGVSSSGSHGPGLSGDFEYYSSASIDGW